MPSIRSFSLRAATIIAVVATTLPAAAAPVLPSDCVLPSDSKCEAWTTTFDQGMFDNPTAGAVSPSGDRIFIAGRTNTTSDFLTIALNAAGAVLWQKRLSGGAFPASATVLPDGKTVVVAGQRGGEGDAVLVAYDAATGTQKWIAQYDSGSYDWALEVVASADGTRLYATGLTEGPGGTYDVGDYLTLAVDATSGAILWTNRSGGANLGNDNPMAIDVSPDGATVAVTGWWVEGNQGPNQISNYGTVAYEASTGVVRWIRKFRGPGTTGNAGNDIAFSPDSTKVYVTGYAQRPFVQTINTDFGTVAYDTATGDELWSDRYDSCIQCWTTSMEVGPDGTVYVGGDAVVAVATGGEFDAAAVAYDGTTGARKWTRVYDNLRLHQLVGNTALSPDGKRLYLSGITQDAVVHTNHLTTVAMNAGTGAVVWDARYGVGSAGATTFNPAKPILLAAPGRLYVSAEMGPPYANDFLIAAYDDPEA